jgi:hypothetical protein
MPQAEPVRRRLPPVLRDAHIDTTAAREDTRGDYKIQRGRLIPYHRLFGQVTSGSVDTDTTNPTPRSSGHVRRSGV